MLEVSWLTGTIPQWSVLKPGLYILWRNELYHSEDNQERAHDNSPGTPPSELGSACECVNGNAFQIKECVKP